ncbi:MAG: hypothetical protein M3357_01440 [Actinomycetota bacterium]|nr:hypothetical protein [Actinomycetota bacterium]
MPASDMPDAEPMRADEQAMAYAAAERRRAQFERRLAAVLREWAEVEDGADHRKALLARAERHEQAAEHHDRAARHQEEAADRMEG